MSIGAIFNTIFFDPIVNLLVLIFHGLETVSIPGALGFSIILLTILIRMLVWPFMNAQLHSARRMAELKPEIDKLKEKHGSDKQAFAAAQMALYKERNINPAGGCLPAIIQLPVIWALYQTIYAFFSGSAGLERINNALYVANWKLTQTPNLDFFGLNLANKPAEFGQIGILVLLIPLLTATLTLVQSKMMTPPQIKAYPQDTKKEKEEKQSTDESIAAMQSQMTYLMPLMIGYFAFQFPIGLALYWNTFTILGIIQQYFVSGWGGLKSWLSFLNRPNLKLNKVNK
ncbi:YidC/Oxa1 family membrane protein insertase [Patescibacteria group bacterium]|nr:YidC/Oxa1 family membrane protein insertase [Patescibacteria group bacterium]MCL5410200.1 YidC/Oxa1 family membrane protein insertase [Patescibacteria group bacterium]